MSDKEPFILRNSKAHEVSYSEVTGKITRKVNRIKDDPEPEAEKPDQKISAEAGQARAPELVKAAAAGRPANPTVQTAQAGQAAGASVSKAAQMPARSVDDIKPRSVIPALAGVHGHRT